MLVCIDWNTELWSSQRHEKENQTCSGRGWQESALFHTARNTSISEGRVADTKQRGSAVASTSPTHARDESKATWRPRGTPARAGVDENQEEERERPYSWNSLSLFELVDLVGAPPSSLNSSTRCMYSLNSPIFFCTSKLVALVELCDHGWWGVGH